VRQRRVPSIGAVQAVHVATWIEAGTGRSDRRRQVVCAGLQRSEDEQPLDAMFDESDP
jgi:hypothetical protein